MLQNAIRKKNEALNYLRLGSRLDAVVSRLDTQVGAQLPDCHFPLFPPFFPLFSLATHLPAATLCFTRPQQCRQIYTQSCML
jgi:hypothetical protein